MLAPGLVAVLGIREALIATGIAVIALVLAGTRSFVHLDLRAVGRVEVLELVANVPFFRRLRVAALEGVVAQLEPVTAPAGTEVVLGGVQDDGRWYLVERGEFEVHVDGFLVNELGRGDGFGELALLRDAPRAASVRARTDASLLALGRTPFLAAVAGPDLEPSGPLEWAHVEPKDDAELLGRTLLLQGVGRRTLEELARRARVREVAAQAPIVVEGELDDCYYVLLSGRAVVTVGAERRRVVLPGDGFGEIAALHRVPRSASVTAEEACRLLTVSADDLRRAARERGGLLGELVAAAPTATARPARSSLLGRGSHDHGV